MTKVKIDEQGFLTLPVLPLKNDILLPRMVLPVKVARAVSVNAVNRAMEGYGSKIFVTFQNDADVEHFDLTQLNNVGVVARIFECSVERDSSLKIFIEGLFRARIVSSRSPEEFNRELLTAVVEPLGLVKAEITAEETAYIRNLKAAYKNYLSLDGERITVNLMKSVAAQTDLEPLVDLIAANLAVLAESDKLLLLQEPNVVARATCIYSFLTKEIEIAKAERNIRKRVQAQVEKHQKDYYLNEQVRAIYKELGKEDLLSEAEKFKEAGKKLKLSAEAYDKLVCECKRLEQMQNASPEAVVSRSYIEWLLAVPWYKESKDEVGLIEAKKILDASHAGMQKAKDVILDFVAAKKFAKNQLKTSPVVCLVGPPGVGKTSLAKSIAASLGRVFVRISLGGLRDEAEIKGHRRTYIGALPGKIISCMRKAGVVNPLILLDEIDKMAQDFRGDPAAALLEVLDPEQNKTFNDHFLEVGYDLSQIVFVATANLFEGIPYPLLDRMEIITLSGYTEQEKLAIAEDFLLPNVLKEHAVASEKIVISAEMIRKVILEHTREAGVRQLGRNLVKITRKCLPALLAAADEKIVVTVADLERWLGFPKFKNAAYLVKESVGAATGLAWTETGGDILEIEVVKLKGKGGLTLTGQLGEVMQESAQASLSYVRTRAKEMGLKEDFYSDSDLHLHVPEGATPKDGPSAGVAIAVALISVLTGIPVDRSVAMSGEITLHGRVLPVGGLKEKLLAAERFGLKTVLVPSENEQEVLEFMVDLGLKLKIIFVQNIEDALKQALVRSPFESTADALAKNLSRRKSVKREKFTPLPVKTTRPRARI